MTNFACYRGEHVLGLEAKTYAIVARKHDDPERSNFLGKSSLMEAIYFALYGEHRHRFEDDWITRGAGLWKHKTDIGDAVKHQRAMREDRRPYEDI